MWVGGGKPGYEAINQPDKVCNVVGLTQRVWLSCIVSKISSSSSSSFFLPAMFQVS